ncbi:MAG: hypothetical protein IJZ85_03725 [Lachnospiraceae bacterium]|nr:hypothetical protein [Lachnospiraceae bacterium]
MRQKKFLAGLIVEAMLCVVLPLITPSGIIGGASLFAFPFQQIGDGLRALSLSGTVGNAAAIVLYVLFCGSPFLVLLGIHRKRKACPEDGLLAGLSTLLFFVMYMMINPGMIPDVLGGFVGAAGTGKMTLGAVLYSILVGYLVLHVLRKTYLAEMTALQQYVKVILYILGAFFIWAVFGAGLGGLRAEITALAEGNTVDDVSSMFAEMMGSGVSAGTMTLSKVFLVIRYVIDVLPYLLDTVIVFTGLELLDALTEDRYGETAVALAQKLSRQCGKMLAITVISNMVFNVVQVIFLEKLLVVDGTVQLPISSILFVMIVMFLARLLTENKELKEDNDLFV